MKWFLYNSNLLGGPQEGLVMQKTIFSSIFPHTLIFPPCISWAQCRVLTYPSSYINIKLSFPPFRSFQYLKGYPTPNFSYPSLPFLKEFLLNSAISSPQHPIMTTRGKETECIITISEGKNYHLSSRVNTLSIKRMKK